MVIKRIVRHPFGLSHTTGSHHPGTTMNTFYSALFLFAISVVVLVVQGDDTNDFTGPGYLNCSYAEWFETDGCASFDLDVLSCPDALSCFANGTDQLGDQLLPTLDASASLIYIRLTCCLTASDCPPSCTFLEGTPPEPDPVSATQNFTGVGVVTCPYVDFFSLQRTGQCLPMVRDSDFSACGSCDIGDLGSNNFTAGDPTIAIPLPCDCLILENCPDTCTFEAGMGSPIDFNFTVPPALAPIGFNFTLSPALAAPTVVTAPPMTTNGTTLSPSSVAPVSAPSPSNVSAPVPSPPVAVSQPVKNPVPAPASNTTSAAAVVQSVWMAIVALPILGWSMVL